MRRTWLGRLVTRNQERRAQVLLQIGTAKDEFVVYDISVALLVFGLITAAITGSTAISIEERWFQTDRGGLLYADDIYPPSRYGVDTHTHGCWNFTNDYGNFSFASTNSSYKYYSFGQELEAYPCAMTAVTDSMKSLMSAMPHFYPPSRYTSSETTSCWKTYDGSVGCEALGAPIFNGTRCGIYSSLDCLPGVQNQVCAPVYRRNPVRCRINGELSNGRVSTENCKANRFYNNTALMGFCPQPDYSLIFNFGIKDDDFYSLLTPFNGSYSNGTAVECTLDPIMTSNVLTNSTVPASQDSELKFISSYNELVLTNTGQDCVMDPNITTLINQAVRMGIAVMMWQLLREIPWSTFKEMEKVAASNEGGNNFTPAFDSSSNMLEDYLGVLIGGATSYYLGWSWPAQVTTPLHTSVNYTLYSERVGSGKTVNVLYILPALISLAIIVWLNWHLVRNLGQKQEE